MWIFLKICEKQFDRPFPEIISNIGSKMRSIDKYLDFFRRTLFDIFIYLCIILFQSTEISWAFWRMRRRTIYVRESEAGRRRTMPRLRGHQSCANARGSLWHVRHCDGRGMPARTNLAHCRSRLALFVRSPVTCKATTAKDNDNDNAALQTIE